MFRKIVLYSAIFLIAISVKAEDGVSLKIILNEMLEADLEIGKTHIVSNFIIEHHSLKLQFSQRAFCIFWAGYDRFRSGLFRGVF